MRRNFKKFMLTLFIFCMVLPALYAQDNKIVSGTIKDEKGAFLQGATIQEKGLGSNRVLSDAAGKFTIKLSGITSRVEISYAGFIAQEVKVTGNLLTVTLKNKDNINSEVVVIGYQQIIRRNLTAAVSSIKGKEIQDIPEASFDQMIQGRLAGVSVLSSTGELGAKAAIVIRGTSNVDYGNSNGGNSGPLYVIDGVIYDVNIIGTSYANGNPLSLINPNDIESIDVLKDASAAAIYGARAGNGVIIIKTKRALRGKPQVSINAYGGVTARPNLRNVFTGSAERALKLKLLYSQAGYNNIAHNTIPIALTDSLNPAFNNDVDWQGLLIRNNAIVNNQDVAVGAYLGSGGSYRISLNHYSEQGVINGYSLSRLSPHLSLNINPLPHVSINTDILISSEKRRHGSGGAGGSLFNSWSFPSSFTQLNPTQVKVYQGNGNIFDDNNIFAINGSISLTDTITKNLFFKSTYASNNYTDKYAYFSPAELNGSTNTAYDIYNSNPSWSFENYLTYIKSVKDHHFVAVGGVSTYSNKQYNSFAYGQGISVTGINTIQTVPSGPGLYVNTGKSEKNTVSYYGRISYDYKGKYLATVSVRRDATSIYSDVNRWATFPSVSAGWIVSDENFMQGSKKIVNFLKFRASWGITGNDPQGFYAKYQPLYTDASYLNSTTGSLSGGVYNGLTGTPSTYNGSIALSPFPYYGGFSNSGVSSSTNVRWEKVIQPDLGVDIELFNSRLAITADVYEKNTKDKYFYNIPAQPTSGYQFYAGNYVDVTNRGLEMAFNSHNLNPKSAFQWNTNFNISFNKNYVARLPYGNRDFLFGPPWFQQSLTLGEPLFNYKVWQSHGVYATDAEVPVDPITGKKLSFNGRPQVAGDAKYVDMNGDYVINFDDKVIAGDPNPKVTGGFGNTFSYKGVSLNIFCSFVASRKIFNGYLSDALNGSSNYSSSWGSNSGPASIPDILNQFWVKDGDHAVFPRMVYPPNGSNDPWNIANSFFVENGAFIKVKQATLAYTFPEKWLNAMKLKSFRVFAMADNLLTFKKSKTVPDPEFVDPTTGSANVVYPSAFKMTLGLNIEL